MDTRVERDPLGEVRVPEGAYYGAQTQRAVENFPISGFRPPTPLVIATVLIKQACARANAALGRLDAEVADAIVKAADEILNGELRDHFVVDIYQAGAGTSHNMNTNEVLANRASEILGEPKGTYKKVHPNDHVNMGQSTNDVFPTATRLSILIVLPYTLEMGSRLATALQKKSEEFAHVLKTGRTHLQDAVPITLGQEFSGYADNIGHATAELARSADSLHELNLGATAVGTGLNAGDDFTKQSIENLAEATKLRVMPARNRFRVTQSMGDVLNYSGALRRLAVEVDKVASDLRLLSSGPRAGLAEIQLPPVQPGSSIMPGKVNPVIPEAMAMVCAQVIGNDTTITIAGQSGNFQLNVMLPVVALNLLQSIEILANASRLLADKSIAGFKVREDKIKEALARNPILVTALNAVIGYDKGAATAKQAYKEGRPILDVAMETTGLPKAKLQELLDPAALTKGGVHGGSAGG